MGTPLQRRINSEAVKEVVILCANGNEDAHSYLSNIAYVSRIFDDLIDKDADVSDEQICRAFYILLAELWLNPFFAKHAQLLIPLHIASFNAFMDSNMWAESEDRLKRIYAHVIKDFINELLGMVAFLTGGYDHMRSVSLKVKEVFLEEV